MLYREVERRLYYQWERVTRRLRTMFVASLPTLELLGAIIKGVQVQIVVSGLLGVLSLGTIGYMVIEGWTIVDALYMTMITITTVGFGEVHPLSDIGRIFTVIVLLLSLGIVTYGVSSAVEYVVTGQVLMKLNERHKREQLSKMQNHFIVVGFGRVGREVAAAFARENVPFLVIDSKPDVLEFAQELGYLAIEGSATEDETLLKAAIDRARGLVACAGNDATNVYAVLTARGLNEKLLIIARAIDDHSESKMLRAGANRVISPYVLSGRRMADLAVRPHVVDFLDLTSASSEIEQALGEVIIEEGSIIVNQTIGQVDLRRRTGANILALFLPNGEWVSNPTASTLLEPSTRLIVLGNNDQLEVTAALARSLTVFNPEGQEDET
ncbi:MAG: potassium channel protein [Anaerolineales bacterium]|nr:potassium channel protein [Anaerolineales bacterium]